jgi:hypothetical protein
METIRLPASVDLSLTQLAAQLPFHGIVVDSVDGDVIRAHLPGHPDTSGVPHWLRAANLIVRRDGDSIVIASRPPVGRIVLTAVLASCSLAGAVAHTAVAWLTVSTVLAACSMIAQYVWLSRQASRRTIRISGSRVGTAEPSSERALWIPPHQT